MPSALYMRVIGDPSIRGYVTAVILAIGTFIPTPVAAQHQAFGPFEVRDQFPIKLLFLSLRPEGAALLPEGAMRLSTRFAYANTYAVTRPIGDPRQPLAYYQDAPLDEYRLFVDAEVLRLAVDLDWRVSYRWQFGAEIPLIIQTGGFLDSTIEGFHRLFRLSNGGREETPRNDYGVFVTRLGRFRVAHDRAPPIRFGDLVLRVKSPLFSGRGRWPVVSLHGAIKLPTGRFKHLTGSGGVDTQVALFVLKSAGRTLAFHYNAAYTFLGQPSGHYGFPVRSIASHMLAIEYLATSRLSVITQILANTSLFPKGRLGPLDRTAYEINAGIKYALTPATLFEISLIENLSQYQNTPDIGLQAGVSVRR